jgi:hypothetical protein
VKILPAPAAPRENRQVLDSIFLTTGRRLSITICIASSRGNRHTPLSSLFSSFKEAHKPLFKIKIFRTTDRCQELRNGRVDIRSLLTGNNLGRKSPWSGGTSAKKLHFWLDQFSGEAPGLEKLNQRWYIDRGRVKSC